MSDLNTAYAKFYGASDLKEELDRLDDGVGSLLKIMVFNKCAGEFFEAGFEAGVIHAQEVAERLIAPGAYMTVADALLLERKLEESER